MAKGKFDQSHIERFKVSGLSLTGYCKAEGIKVSGLQYHLAKSRQREADTAVKFISVTAPARAEWFTLQIGSGGLWLKFNIDFRL